MCVCGEARITIRVCVGLLLVCVGGGGGGDGLLLGCVWGYY